MVKKLKSSALLMALLIGIMMSGLVVGVSAVVNEHISLAGQSREGRLAYRAALSGVEEGLLAVKYARANGRLPELYGETFNRDLTNGDSDVQPTDMSYEMSVDAPFGSTFADSQSYTNLGEWPSETQKENLKEINADDTYDIDLTRLINEKNLREIDIYFSGPYSADEVRLDSNYTALNWSLLDLSKNKTTGTEKQLIASYTNSTNGRKTLRVSPSDIASCVKDHNECHLRIRPQIVSPISRTPLTRRFAGVGAGTDAGKHVYLALKAIDKSGSLIVGESSENNGIIVITSVGKVGQAVRKLTARIDASNGAYLGLFDFGIYCGTNCTNLSPDQP